MAIEKELLDQLLEGRDPETVFTQDGLLDELKKGLSERVLNAELDAHLDAETADGKTNRHNGRSQKTVLTGTSKVTLDIPRDRAGTFDPQLIAKYQRRFPDFDEKIISMYARGMTVREIRGHLQELYGIEVSPDLISTVTDAVLEEVSEWQNRPLDACYAIVFFDAIRVKIRDEGFVRNKAVYIALAILPDGTKEILGLWIEQTEGAKFWLRVMNELKNRGMQDILLAVVDGLKGFPEAINATFPETVVQTCIVHLIRHSMNFASWKNRKHVAKALRDVYRAKDADAGLAALDAFEAGPWGEKYPAIAQSWRRNWEHLSPFFVFPEAVRRIVYTTNAIESLNAADSHQCSRSFSLNVATYSQQSSHPLSAWQPPRSEATRLRRNSGGRTADINEGAAPCFRSISPLAPTPRSGATILPREARLPVVAFMPWFRRRRHRCAWMCRAARTGWRHERDGRGWRRPAWDRSVVGAIRRPATGW